MDHRLDEFTGHAREGEQAFYVHGDQRADDVAHVATGAKVSAIGGEHHGLDVVGIGQGTERVAQLGIGFECEWILPLRPIELDDGHRTFHAP